MDQMRRILFPLVVVLIFSCKIRNVEKDTSETKVTNKISSTSTDQGHLQEKTNSKFDLQEQSGTWVWEEWYDYVPQPGDSTGNKPAAATSDKKPTYKRTTFQSSNKKQTGETSKVSDLKTASTKDLKIHTDSLSKELTKKTESKPDHSWLLWLTPLVLIVFYFMYKKITRRFK